MQSIIVYNVPTRRYIYCSKYHFRETSVFQEYMVTTLAFYISNKDNTQAI